MPSSLKGKTALITGATGAIGSAIAYSFAREGCTLILSGRSKEKLDALTKEIPGTAAVAADVSFESDVDALFRDVSALDVLVCAAGTYGEIGPLSESKGADWMRAVSTNLFGTVLCIQRALPLLRKAAHGKIITFAGGGEGALPNFSSYAASKAGVLRLTETLAKEEAFKNIDINAISPGAVKSGLTQALIAAGEEKAGTEIYQKNVQQMEEGGESPEKAAALAVFLASEASNGLSGKNISAVWDSWRDIPKHLKEIMESDVYASRRIKPKDRGYEW